ncbi:MAG: anti-sigma factor [Dokdonella sp.]
MNTTADNMGTDAPERGDLAAEYVLGVLDAAGRRTAVQRMAREPAFAYDVAAWESRLTSLVEEITPVPPPFALWPRILSAVGLPAEDRTRASSSRTEARPSLWQSAALWRWLTAGGFAAAAASLAMLLLTPQVLPPPPPTTAPMVAKMVQDDGKSLYLATVDARLGTMVVQPTTVDIPPGRVAELWLIPPGDIPHSLGVLDSTKANSVVVPKNLIAALGPHAIVAVTVEPPGGGPGGKPTGPIIAKGEISLL